MEYKEKYEAALERAREIHGEEASDESIDTCEYIFPELAESKDERIVNALISHLTVYEKNTVTINCVPVQDILAWLEKQKEQKPRWEINNPHADVWTREKIDAKMEELIDEYHNQQQPAEPSDDELQRHQDELHDFKVFAAKQAREHHISFVHDFEWNNFCGELLSYFNERQKPAEWSEEDEKWMKLAIHSCEMCGNPVTASWLKSLRPSWKPSEEQMSILKKAVEHYRNDWVGATIKEQNALTSLYEQLKKLKSDEK